MAWLVEALHYKPEGRGFDSQWGHCFNLSGRIMALGVNSAFNRNEYREYLLEVEAASAECLEILAGSDSWSPKGLSRPVMR